MSQFRIRSAVVVLAVFVVMTFSDSARAFAEEPPSAPCTAVAAGPPDSVSTELSPDCYAKPELLSQIGGWNPAHHKKRLSLKATLIIVGVVVGAVYVLAHVLVPYT